MALVLNPYISFRNNAREALEFYRGVFGGEASLVTFAEYQASEAPEDQDLVMHAQLDTPAGFTLMMSDTPTGVEYTGGSSISISVSGSAIDEDALRGYWERLCDGGTVFVALEPAMWGDTYGMVKDRFEVEWMIMIAPAEA